VTSEEAAAFFPGVFELATGGVRIVFAESRSPDLLDPRHYVTTPRTSP
jgi:hypothetical protein